MKDCMNNELLPGAIVVVKPTSRTSFMGMGFVKKAEGSRASVVSFRRTSWYDKDHKRVSGAFEQPSIYRVRSAKDMMSDHCFPEDFPEQLKKEYTDEFLTRANT